MLNDTRHRLVRGAKTALFSLHLGGLPLVAKTHQLLGFGRWCEDSGVNRQPHFNLRRELFEHIHGSTVGQPIDYLEFGVFEGESIRQWAGLNRDPQSRFYGFDSFAGLPETWKHTSKAVPAGFFSTGGKVPEIDDPRVQFVVGTFQESLGPFLEEWRPRNRLVVLLDADLYSSTLFVLSSLSRYLVPGTILLFDDFAFVNDVFRAYTDFSSAFPVKMKPTAWAGGFYDQVAFEA